MPCQVPEDLGKVLGLGVLEIVDIQAVARLGRQDIEQGDEPPVKTLVRYLVREYDGVEPRIEGDAHVGGGVLCVSPSPCPFLLFLLEPFDYILRLGILEVYY